MNRDVIPFSKNLLPCDVLAELQEAFGVHRLPRFATSRTLGGPIAIGIFRPQVVLPESMVMTLSPDQVREVLLHECAHIIRRDAVVGVLQRLAEMLFWLHPLVHLLNRKLTLAREEVCDNHVLLRSDGRSFGQTLLQLSEIMVRTGMRPAALGLFEPRWPLEERVAGLLDTRRKIVTRMNRITGAVSIVATLAIVITIGATNIMGADLADEEGGSPPDQLLPATEKEADSDAAINDVGREAAEALKSNGADIDLNDQDEVVAVMGRRFREDLENVTKLNWATTRSLIVTPNQAAAMAKLEPLNLNARRHDDRVYFDAPDGITIQLSAADRQP